MEAAGVRNKVRVYRATFGMTQEQLGAQLGVSRQTVIAIESNKYSPSLSLALRMAALFRVKVEDLFSLDDEEDGKS
jgi:putative transcriptional regulator